MTFEPLDNLAQAARAAQLPIYERDQLSLTRKLAHPMIAFGLVHRPVERGPRNLLQKIMKNSILARRGVAPICCPVTSPTSEHKINQHRAAYLQKLNRTAAAQDRPCTQFDRLLPAFTKVIEAAICPFRSRLDEEMRTVKRFRDQNFKAALNGWF